MISCTHIVAQSVWTSNGILMCMESRYEALCKLSWVSVPYGMRYRLSGRGQEAYIPGADESLQELLVQLSGNIQLRQILYCTNSQAFTICIWRNINVIVVARRAAF